MRTRLAPLLLMVTAAPLLQAQESDAGRAERLRELHDRMHLAVGSHFTVSFEGPEQAALAARALESLDRAYWRIGEALNTFPSTPVPVVLYTAEQFHDITRGPAWAAGAFDGTIRVPMRGALDRPDELDRVMAHEFTHAVVRTLAPRGVPTWLGEGLAAALERPSLDWADARVRAAGAPLPLSALTGSFARFSGATAELAYATSAVAVGRLLDSAGGVALANLLRDLGQGAALAPAFAHRMQQPFDEFAAGIGSMH